MQFNARAAALIIEDGYLLLHRAVGDDFWVLPGGRVEPNESAAQATTRELLEETGQAIKCEGLAFCVENFFEWQGHQAHEIGFYFHASLPLTSPLANKQLTHSALEGTQALEYRWFELAALATLPVHPEFLRTTKLTKGSPVQHVVQGTPGRRAAGDA